METLNVSKSSWHYRFILSWPFTTRELRYFYGGDLCAYTWLLVRAVIGSLVCFTLFNFVLCSLTLAVIAFFYEVVWRLPPDHLSAGWRYWFIGAGYFMAAAGALAAGFIGVMAGIFFLGNLAEKMVENWWSPQPADGKKPLRVFVTVRTMYSNWKEKTCKYIDFTN